MAAEFEEIVVTADAVNSKQIGPNPRQTLFGFAAKRLVVAGGESVSLRRGERLPVELAVGGQRQRLEPNIGRRDHVFGQARRQMSAQRLGPQRGRVGVAPYGVIGHERKSPGASLRASATASRTAGCSARRASISPSSIRKPRTFT